MLQPLREQREQSAAAATEEDHATKLPAGLKDFTPLAAERRCLLRDEAISSSVSLADL